MIGKTLNHFKVLDRLGKGGMGEVYVAEDSRLKRRVALKVLPEEMAQDPVRLERFQREAETIAARLEYKQRIIHAPGVQLRVRRKFDSRLALHEYVMVAPAYT